MNVTGEGRVGQVGTGEILEVYARAVEVARKIAYMVEVVCERVVSVGVAEMGVWVVEFAGVDVGAVEFANKVTYEVAITGTWEGKRAHAAEVTS